jgi:hypothetical protein
MSDEREPPAKPPTSVVTDLGARPQLTKAVTRKGEIRFELHVPENDSAPALAEDLRRGFFLGGMPRVPAKEGPIGVYEREHDKSTIEVVYKPHGKRSLDEDMRAMVAVFEEMEIPVTSAATEGMRQAFDALKTLNAQGRSSAVAAEAERRSAKKGPRGRG